MKKYMQDFKIIQNRRITPDYFVLELECPEILPEILPGQFAEVRVDHSPQTYLRRPISIYDVDYRSNRLKLLIKKVGIGSAKLFDLTKGLTLNLIYPLGNSFSLPEGNKVLLVGGGVGCAPLLLLAKQLNSKGVIVHALIGGRTDRDIVDVEKFSTYCKSVYITTDDGSLGEMGMVTQHSLFADEVLDYSKIYSCGPDAMMRAIARLATFKGIDCEVSLENLMACGIGACLCCIVETSEGNKTTCVQGPVFNIRDLKGWS
ncbi:MAG: dihydroorotate dehydrogenase electron transfer subunit [Bacteroidetes bacterium]|nr:dihydroorotate dehydrogenase electron transfer subunit [Bacteroidota bacterium]